MNDKELAKRVYGAVRDKAETLLVQLDDRNPKAREAAAEALGRLGCFEAVPALIRLLDDTERSVRWAAAGALGDLQSNEAVPELIKLLGDRDTREAAALALGEIGSETATAPLLELLNDPSAQVRLTTIDALGQIGSTEALPALREVAMKRDETERRCAEMAIELIRSSGADLVEFQEEEASEPNLADHPSLASFAEGIRGAWTYQIQHVRECEFCQRLVAAEWSIRHPEVKTLAAYSADPTQFPYAVAMRSHMEQDNCRRCTLLLQSRLVAALAALDRVGKKLELKSLSTQAPRLQLQQMAPVQDVYAYEHEGDSSLTLHENESHSLMVLADISPEFAVSDRVRVEIIGNRGYRALDSKTGEDFEVSSVTSATREFGEDIAVLAASASNHSLKELTDWMGEPTVEVRLAAIQTVGALGAVAATPEIVARLQELLNDPDERVRKAAKDALTAMPWGN